MILTLIPHFNDDDLITTEVNHDQIGKLFEIFRRDFIDDPFLVRGKNVKINMQVPKVKEYECYCETFYHIITRKYGRDRLYDCHRANRIHWIKPILTSQDTKNILRFKWKDEDNFCKDHFWCQPKQFMVVLKEISPEYLIVTSFCVDKSDEGMYYERYKSFKAGESQC